MSTFQQVKFLIALCLLMVVGLSKINAAPVHDTVFVCNGTAVKMRQLDSTGKTYRWFNASNTQVATTNTYVVTGGVTGVTFTPANTPVVNTYKLVVDSTGGGTCPSDTFYKVIVSLPSFNTFVTTPASFFCTGSIPANVVLKDSVVATGSSATVPNVATFSGYVALNYAWTGTPAGVSTTNVYTVPGASLIAAGVGSYTYTVATSYTLTPNTFVLGTGASTVGACTGSANGTITISAPPAVTATNVTTSFQ
jgi:hypothetical protein